MKRKHSLLCRLVMALASRRVCTCGASRPASKAKRYRDVLRRRDRELARPFTTRTSGGSTR